MIFLGTVRQYVPYRCASGNQFYCRILWFSFISLPIPWNVSTRRYVIAFHALPQLYNIQIRAYPQVLSYRYVLRVFSGF